MLKAVERPMAQIDKGAKDGLRLSVRKAFAEVTAEPLPVEHVELLLALRRRERDQAARAA